MRLPPARNNRKLPPAVSPPSAGETASDAAGAKTGAGPRATGPGWQEAVEQGTAGPGNIVYNAKARPDLNGHLGFVQWVSKWPGQDVGVIVLEGPLAESDDLKKRDYKLK